MQAASAVSGPHRAANASARHDAARRRRHRRHLDSRARASALAASATDGCSNAADDDVRGRAPSRRAEERQRVGLGAARGEGDLRRRRRRVPRATCSRALRQPARRLGAQRVRRRRVAVGRPASPAAPPGAPRAGPSTVRRRRSVVEDIRLQVSRLAVPSHVRRLYPLSILSQTLPVLRLRGARARAHSARRATPTRSWPSWRVRAPLFAGRRAGSLYFGGGTPGLWRADCIARVIAAVRAAFARAAGGTAGGHRRGQPRRSAARAPGRAARRRRQPSLARRAVAQPTSTCTRSAACTARDEVAPRRRRRARGRLRPACRSISCSRCRRRRWPSWRRDLAGVLALAPDHLSVYNLTVEERTAFGACSATASWRCPRTASPPRCTSASSQRLAGAGFDHYEISSWARPGRARACTTRSTGPAASTSASAARRTRFAGSPTAAASASAPCAPSTSGCDGADRRRRAETLDRRRARARGGLARAAAARRRRSRRPRAPARRRSGRAPTPPRSRVSSPRGWSTSRPSALRLTPRGVLFADEVGARFV